MGLYSLPLTKKRDGKHMISASGKRFDFLGFQDYSCQEQVFSVIDLTAKGAQASQHPATGATRENRMRLGFFWVL